MAVVKIRHLLAVLLVVAVAGCQTDGDGQGIDSSKASNTYGESGVNSAARAKLLASSKFSPKLLQQATAATGKTYFVDFRSRYALTYGHTFVYYGRVNSAGREVSVKVAGLAPKSDDPAVYSAGHLVPVESSTGATDGDLEWQYMTAMWRVMLTKPEYDKVVAEIRRMQNKHKQWHAVIYNCNAFVGDIAAFMGYNSKPAHLLVPRDYITQLRKRNGGKNPIAWTAPSAKSPPGLS